MDWNKLVKAVADRGRNGDSMLAHITPEEAQHLKDRGGSGSINPETGLYEFYDDPGAGAQMGPAGSGNPSGLGMDNTAGGDTGKSPNAIDWGSGFSLSSLADKFTNSYGHSHPNYSTDPVAKGVQMGASAMVPGFGLMSTLGSGLAAGMEMLGGKGISDAQAAAQGAAFSNSPSSGDNTATPLIPSTQPIPDTSTIGTVPTPTPAHTGQDLSGLNPSRGLPPSVLDYLLRIGVVSL